MNVQQRIAALRERMAQENMQAYIVVTDDFHGSEYVWDYFKARSFMTGFTGSAGTLVVLKEEAALWTDGRYFLQAARQLQGSGITLMRMGEENVPKIPQFLAEHLPEKAVIGFDGRTISNGFAGQIIEQIKGKNISFAYDKDLVDAIWTERPALSKEPVWELEASYVGCT
ncbi:MAG: aminopeptidase P family N-terminal domain-containing protein, partial [Lachnospiraceae bacterium]|nr:aminopeptidase P family N-terminal domain-containing protein [Lachnospiraceae bacterium]